MERGRIQGLPSTPIISGTGRATNFKLVRYIHRVHANKSLLKIWQNRDRGLANPGTAQIFGVPPVISGMGKATNFKFDTYIHRVYPNKSPVKFSEKMERGRIQGLPQFFEYPYYLRNG